MKPHAAAPYQPKGRCKKNDAAHAKSILEPVARLIGYFVETKPSMQQAILTRTM